MRDSFPLAMVLSLSLITTAAAQTDEERHVDDRPTETADLPDLPPAPPETTRPADEPAGADSTVDRPAETESPVAPARDVQADRPVVRSDSQFGARFNVDADGRFIVRSVVDGGLAARTGFLADDVILSVDGQTFDTESDLRFYLRSHSGDRIPITILRNGRERTVFLHDGSDGDSVRPALGVRFVRGPVLRIVDVVAGSPADQAGIVAGDRLVSLNGDQFASTDAFISAVARADVDEPVELVVNRNGEIIVDSIHLDDWEEVFDAPGTTVTALRPDFDGDGVEVITPHCSHAHPAAYGFPYYWTGYRYATWPYWSAYAGPYFYAPYPGPIYYGPSYYNYWPANVSWQYPVYYSARVW